VTIAWSPTGTARTSYIVEAGYRSGASDVLRMSIGRATHYTATRITPAIYYARVRAKNTCGTSAPSPEIRVRVE
jgi:hypothetical protein